MHLSDHDGDPEARISMAEHRIDALEAASARQDGRDAAQAAALARLESSLAEFRTEVGAHLSKVETIVPTSRRGAAAAKLGGAVAVLFAGVELAQQVAALLRTLGQL